MASTFCEPHRACREILSHSAAVYLDPEILRTCATLQYLQVSPHLTVNPARTQENFSSLTSYPLLAGGDDIVDITNIQFCTVCGESVYAPI